MNDYTLTHEKTFKLYVKSIGQFVEERSWDREIDALNFLMSLPYGLSDQMIVLPVQSLVLVERM